jgi:hypothetical protein
MDKKSFSALVTATILGLLLTTSANANIIQNGGFEATPTGPSLGGSGFWKYYSANSIAGWSGSNLELWTNNGQYEGEVHAELNAHASTNTAWSIFQTFSTISGQRYDLFFAYKARRASNSGSDEVFRVNVASDVWTVSDHVTNSWKTFSQSFVATGATTTLRFTAVTPSTGTLGNFLDDIRVTVPEPGALALLGLGLLGLGIAKKRTKRA